jgi:hypothetical protein
LTSLYGYRLGQGTGTFGGDCRAEELLDDQAIRDLRPLKLAGQSGIASVLLSTILLLEFTRMPEIPSFSFEVSKKLTNSTLG